MGMGIERQSEHYAYSPEIDASRPEPQELPRLADVEDLLAGPGIPSGSLRD